MKANQAKAAKANDQPKTEAPRLAACLARMAVGTCHGEILRDLYHGGDE